jgi:hypothetical protein
LAATSPLASILGKGMKVDYQTARMRTHRRNIQRYGRLLATKLTDLERRYLHRQIAEEQAELERLAREGRALATGTGRNSMSSANRMGRSRAGNS